MNDDDELLIEAKQVLVAVLSGAMPATDEQFRQRAVNAVCDIIDVKLTLFTEMLADRVETRMPSTPSLSNGGA